MGPASPGAGRAAVPRHGWATRARTSTRVISTSWRGRAGREPSGMGLACPTIGRQSIPVSTRKGSANIGPTARPIGLSSRSQEVITRKYLAYFTEKDPRSEPNLLRDYNRTRTKVSRAMSGRRENPSRALDAATGADVDRADRSPPAAPRRDDLAAGTADAKPRSSSSRRVALGRGPSTDAGRRGGTDSIPPPPPLFPGGFQPANQPAPQPPKFSIVPAGSNLGDDVNPAPAATRPAASSVHARPAAALDRSSRRE